MTAAHATVPAGHRCRTPGRLWTRILFGRHPDRAPMLTCRTCGRARILLHGHWHP